MAAAGREKALAAVRDFFERYEVLDKDGEKKFDHYLLTNMKLIDASPEGGVVFEFTIPPNWANVNGVMHGGAAGVICDMCTTIALCPLSTHDFWDFFGGVSRTMNISYLRPVPIGATVRFSSRVISMGRTMAMLRGEMISVDGKKTYITVEHHKVHVPVQPSQQKAFEAARRSKI